ncbi:MAG: formimidoylglutamase [Phycisphaerales bacterium]|nr:formimidoylglutamase [Phycisphaerales bacterium]
MPLPIPHTLPAPWPDRAAGRFSSTIATDAPEGCAVALLGLPDDTGVTLNRGRPGAAEGPRAFREALARYGVESPEGRPWPRVFDAGDIRPDTTNLAETHRRVTSATESLLDLGLLPVAIGGGHDLTFPFVRALASRTKPLQGVYFDPHLDVRPEPGSGMAFRALIEQCGLSGLDNFGFSPLVNSAEHRAWFTSNGGAIGDETHLSARLEAPHHDLFVSLDLDVIDMAFAPGVSAMNPCGWTPRQAEEAAFLAGASERVRCFDIMELSPPHDDSGRTARLAAHLFLAFLRGFTERSG